MLESETYHEEVGDDWPTETQGQHALERQLHEKTGLHPCDPAVEDEVERENDLDHPSIRFEEDEEGERTK